jgi:hypothetical protein
MLRCSSTRTTRVSLWYTQRLAEEGVRQTARQCGALDLERPHPWTPTLRARAARNLLRQPMQLSWHGCSMAECSRPPHVAHVRSRSAWCVRWIEDPRYPRIRPPSAQIVVSCSALASWEHSVHVWCGGSSSRRHPRGTSQPRHRRLVRRQKCGRRRRRPQARLTAAEGWEVSLATSTSETRRSVGGPSARPQGEAQGGAQGGGAYHRL